MLKPALFAIIAVTCVAAAQAQDTPPAPEAPVVGMDEFCTRAMRGQQRYYPERAQQRNLNGAATLDCILTPAGTLATCQIVDETPADFGFGEAAMLIACRWTPEQIRLANETPYAPGERHVRRTVRFELAAEPPPERPRGSIMN